MLNEPFDFPGEAVANVPATADARVDEGTPGRDPRRRVELRRHPLSFVTSRRLSTGFKQTKSGGRSSKLTGDGDHPSRPGAGSPEQGASRAETANQRGRQRQRPKRPAEVSA